ncbi:PQQ-binding-like beta-propeller repeat protein [Aporhodopirellula rubra]
MPMPTSVLSIVPRLFSIGCAACVVVLTLAPCHADPTDWPQWRGPQRDGHAAPQMLAQSWEQKAPRLKWEADNVGIGYSSMSIVDGRLYTMGADEKNCFTACYESNSGKRVWKTNIARAGVGGDYNRGWGGGPRSTPTVDGDQVFVLSDIGVVAALTRDTGDLIWKVDLVADLGGGIPKWGYSESVLIDGERVVVTAGGSKFMVALDRQTGELIWNSEGTDAKAHYVSTMKGSFAGTPYYVTAAEIGVVAFDCQTGKKLFENALSGNGTATIPTPLLIGSDRIYHTSAYGAGNVLLKLTGGSDAINAEVVYLETGKSMENHHGGVVLVDGVIYGFTKANGGNWMAQDLATGETLWQEKIRGNKSGSIAYADGRLYCYNDGDGSVILVQPERNEWKPAGQIKLPHETELPRDRGAIWAHPVIANQTLFIRDQDLMFAFDISR